MRSRLAGILALLAAMGCGQTPDSPAAEGETAGTVLAREVARVDSIAAAIDGIFQPLPLLSFAEETALRRFSNAQHLARARALGVPRGSSDDRLLAFESEGRLARLETGPYYVVRQTGRQALAVPHVAAMLDELGRRFQMRLADLGSPPFRFEVSSVLRTAEDQATLRRVNPNAALGESTHEFGTTVDILYSAFSAPAAPTIAFTLPHEARDLEPSLRRHADVALERVAGRRALELKAVLGKALLEMQNQGRVLVTIERLQPVYHVTIARAP
jgi:hypothetical protein